MYLYIGVQIGGDNACYRVSCLEHIAWSAVFLQLECVL